MMKKSNVMFVFFQLILIKVRECGNRKLCAGKNTGLSQFTKKKVKKSKFIYNRKCGQDQFPAL